ncbi:hypothetical protein GQ43DRAFT_310034 [Delitschia confertaspora ATCC 74209]|uniref:Uncharacterized protein n=1 Tax=Delitschia confertaspora ATCC 74209 TaxID=1513339 RepID=A0A9P4JZT0_9PLEO|nr:hypothetical protein GQ43DRAFT_310034 [Delitschia confertaspora ATCC 74209]
MIKRMSHFKEPRRNLLICGLPLHCAWQRPNGLQAYFGPSTRNDWNKLRGLYGQVPFAQLGFAPALSLLSTPPPTASKVLARGERRLGLIFALISSHLPDSSKCGLVKDGRGSNQAVLIGAAT